MQGNDVFKVAVRTLSRLVDETLAKNGIDKQQIDWLVPHQANLRIIQSAADKLDMPMEKVIVTVQEHGNTSAATIPLALDTAVRDGRIRRGQLLLMVFLTVSTAVIFPLLGVKYSLILAVIVGVLDVIPGIGATLGIVLISLMVFASQGGDIGLRALIASVLLGQIQDNIVRPRVMGQAMELNPVILFLALFIGQRVAGLLGVFLSIPLAGMIAIWVHSERQPQEPIILTPAVED